MPVQYPPESEHAKERVKWEAHHTPFGPGLRPYQFHPLPSMLYKAQRVEGQIVFEHETVTTDEQRANLQSRGWADGPTLAIEALEAADLEVAKAAANRAYHEQRMSAKAQLEAAAAEAVHSGHLGSVPETPIKKHVAVVPR